MTITSVSLLMKETRLGTYQAQIMRRGMSGWTPTIPPVHVVVTNLRLLFIPQTRKPYPPASIPRRLILEVREVDFGRRPGVMLWLRTGHRIYLSVSGTGNRDIAELVPAMTPSQRHNPFTRRLPRPALSRLIAYIEGI